MIGTPIPLEYRIIFALDLADTRQALALVDRLDEQIRFFKVGLQLFFASDWPVVERITHRSCKVMPDLKVHDIPATVRLAMRQFADRGVTCTTVHGYRPVVEAALAADTGISLLAVTVLTRTGAEEATELGLAGTVKELVLRQAANVLQLGCHVVACSAQEALPLRQRLGQDFVMVTPHIRPTGAKTNDQQRVAPRSHALRETAPFRPRKRALPQLLC